MASIFKQRYTEKDKNGKRIRKQTKCWYIDYKTADGTRKRVKGFKDKAATTQLAAKLEKEAEQAEIGIVDKYKEHRNKPLLEHLEDFKQSLLGKGDTEKQARQVYNRAKAVVENCRFIYIPDVSGSSVQKYLADRRRGGLSIRTSNFYLQAIKQFCNWLVSDRRAAENPLAYLQGQNPKTDIRHERRALTLKELKSLLKGVLTGKKHHNLTGEQRYMLYTLALTTGFRCKELASLTWRMLNLNESKPSITVLAGYAKNKREVTLPLRKDVAEQFRQWLSNGCFSQSEKIFPKFNESRGAEMLRKDLEAVKIPYQDESGRYADFHSLRHSFASILHESGVSPKVAQSLLRHSTIGLTMDTYTHIGLYDERAVALKTGTDDSPVKTEKSAYKPAYKKLAKNAYFDSQQPSSFGNDSGNKGGKKSQEPDADNSLPETYLGTGTDGLSPHDIKRSRRDSNPRYLSVQRFSRPSR
jgi:integrase